MLNQSIDYKISFVEKKPIDFTNFESLSVDEIGHSLLYGYDF